MPDQNSRSNPYVGPRAFQRGDNLYGRDNEIRELLNLLIAQRILLLNSPSGAGKTSLIQAGLVPRLEKEDFHVFLPVARVNLEPPRESNGRQNKYNRYVFSVLASLEADLPEEQKTPQDILINMSLADYLDQGPKDPGTPDTQVLIFDQFEEILTVAPFDREGKAAFFAQIGAALRDRRRWALFAIREDYVAALDPYAQSVPTHLANTFRLDLLGVESARQAIMKPAQNKGVTFTEEAAQKLVDDLRLVRVQSPDLSVEAQKEPEEQEGPYVEPVQLQVVCYRLWEQLAEGAKKITEKDVADIGDVDTALAEYYAERVKTISEETGVKERAIRDWFDYRLITERGMRNQVLLEPDKIGLELEAIRQLVDAHLVRQERRGGAIYFELAHDRLVRPVLDNNTAWKADHLSVLQRQASRWWREGQKPYLLLHSEALAEAETWASSNPDEITDLDQEFLEASRQRHDKEEHERVMAEQAIRLESAEKLAEAERQRREAAEKLAETERERSEEQAAAAAKLLRRLILVVVFLIAAIGFAVIAGIQSQRARTEYLRAQTESLRAQTEEAVAKNAEATAKSAEAIAKDNETAARTAEATAKAAEAEAELERKIATARQFAAQAANLKSSQPDLALLLSLEGNALAEQIAAETDEVVLDPKSSLLDVLIGSQLIGSFLGNPDYLTSLAFSQAGSLLVSGDYSGNLVMWDIASGQSITQTNIFDPVLSLSASPDGNLVAVGDYYGGVHLWNVQDGEVEPLLDPTYGLARGVAFSPDGRLLAAAGTGLNLGQTNDRLLVSLSNSDYQSQLAFSQAGELLAAVNLTGFVEVWSANESRLVAQLTRQDSSVPIVYLAFTSDDQGQPLFLLAVEEGGQLVAWDLTNGLEQPVSYQAPGSLIAYSPAQSVLASDKQNGTIQVCQLNIRANLTCSASRIFVGPPGPSTVLAISPDGRLLAKGSEDGSIILWQLTGNALTGPPLEAHKSEVVGLAFQAGEEDLKLVSGAGGEDKSLILWDLQTRQPDTALVGATQKSINFVSASLAYSPDGKILASGDQDGDIRLWDTQTFTLINELSEHLLPVQSVAFSPNGRLLAAGSQDRTITLWDQATGQLINRLSGQSATVNSLAFSPDGKVLASGGGDGKVILWDATSGQIINSYIGKIGIIYSLAFSPDGRTLAAGGGSVQTRDQTGEGTSLLYWDLTSPGDDPCTLQSPVHVVSHLAFSPDGQFLASGSPDGEVFVWDFSDCSQISRRPLAWEIGSITGLSFSLDSRSLIIGSDQGLYLWDVVTLERKVLPDGDRLTTSPVVDPNSGSIIAAGKEQGGIYFWSLVTTDILDENISSDLEVETDQEVSTLAISPNGETLASGGSEGTILLWDPSSRQPIGPPLRAHDKKVTSLAFSPDGDMFASGGIDGIVKIWNSGGQKMNQYSEPGTSVSALAFSPRAPLLAISFTDPYEFSSLYLWDLADPDSQPELVDEPLSEDEFWPVTSMAFDAGGGRLAVGRGNGMISLWDVSEREWLPPLSARVSAGQEFAVKSLAFSGDGAWLASGIADGGLILWSGQDLQQVGRLGGHVSSVDALAFSPDSQILASGGADTVVLLWEVDPEKWVNQACRAVNRNLRWAEWVKYVDPKQNEPYHETCPGNFVPSDVAAGILDRAKTEGYGPEQVEADLKQALEINAQENDLELSARICDFGVARGFQELVAPACEFVDDFFEEDPQQVIFYAQQIGAKALVEKGFREAAQEALTLEDVHYLNSVCWDGSLERFANAVLPACERAVELANESDLPLFRDSRGLARALTGDYAGAIEDFQFLVDWLRGEGSNTVPEEVRDPIIARREMFIAALAEGQNPFDDETLQELAEEIFYTN